MNATTERLAWTVSFGTTGKAPKRILEGTNLSESLDIRDSPLLFGCRTGICGTCSSKVVVLRGKLAPASPEERETSLAVCPEEPEARLACQLKLTADIDIVPVART